MTERILKMPRLGETMDEGKVVGWLIKPGDSFKRGDPILEIETDKTIAEFPALGDGRLKEVLVSIGDVIEVGKPLARIEIGQGPDWTLEDGEDAEIGVEAAVASTMPSGDGKWVETDLAMPRLGETMEEGRVVKWLKAPAETFARGEAILEIETDKTIAEFPALTDGRLIRILTGEGEMVTVGEPIARIDVPAEALTENDAKPSATSENDRALPAVARSTAPTVSIGGRVRATPLARQLARRHGVDITRVSGSGRRGRIEKIDVLATIDGTTASTTVSVPADVKYASLSRGRMAYLDSGPGSGLPVLLLHGFSGDRTTWAAVMSGLKRAGRRVIVPDLPGHGATEIAALGISDLGADLSKLLDALDIQKLDVVAHSIGALAAAELASAAHTRIASLSLLAPAGLGSDIDSHFVYGMANAKATGEVAHLLRRLSVNRVELSDMALQALTGDLSRGRLIALAEAAVGPSGQKADILAALEKLSTAFPVRVLFGLEDKIIPWTQVRGLPPRVAIHLLARSGHMPQWDQTKDVLDILLS